MTVANIGTARRRTGTTWPKVQAFSCSNISFGSWAAAPLTLNVPQTTATRSQATFLSVSRFSTHTSTASCVLIPLRTWNCKYLQ